MRFELRYKHWFDRSEYGFCDYFRFWFWGQCSCHNRATARTTHHEQSLFHHGFPSFSFLIKINSFSCIVAFFVGKNERNLSLGISTNFCAKNLEMMEHRTRKKRGGEGQAIKPTFFPPLMCQASCWKDFRTTSTIHLYYLFCYRML